MSVPYKYRELGDFHKYYSGEKRAPILTLVIGGNHEASNYFFELFHGGWLAPNIYYLGAAGVLRYGSYRILGLSGIFKDSEYRKGHHERLPYDRNGIRSIYHVRECDVTRLLQIQTPVDIGLSHDWPRRVEFFGDYKKLFAMKPHFFDSVNINNLGSHAAEQILCHLRPSYWFSGHMHVKFSATVTHPSDAKRDLLQDLEIPERYRSQMPPSMFQPPFKASKPRGDKRATTSTPSKIKNLTTQFLALDKPGPQQNFLSLLEIPAPNTSTLLNCPPCYLQKLSGKYTLHYDEEWLSITRSFSSRVSMDSMSFNRPSSTSEEQCIKAIPKNLKWVKENITAKELLRVPENFERHAPVLDPSEKVEIGEQPEEYPNKQTEVFCRLLGMEDGSSKDEDNKEDGDGWIVFE